MPGKVVKKPSRFNFDASHVLMSQRKEKSLKKMEQRNRKEKSRKNKKEVKESQTENVVKEKIAKKDNKKVKNKIINKQNAVKTGKGAENSKKSNLAS